MEKEIKKEIEKDTITDLYTGTIFIQYESTDFQKTFKFYHEGLGFKFSDFSEKTNPEEVGLLEFNLPAKGAILSFSKKSVEKFQVNDSLIIEVNDIDKLYESLTTRQINSSEITDVPNMLSFMTVKDLDGNLIMFISNPRKKT